MAIISDKSVLTSYMTVLLYITTGAVLAPPPQRNGQADLRLGHLVPRCPLKNACVSTVSVVLQQIIVKKLSIYVRC